MSSRFLHKHLSVVFWSAFISVLLSVWCIYIDPIVNNDGIQYFRVADRLLAGQWHQALAIHHWPFYSMLIAVTSKFTGLNVEISAHLLNTALFVLMVVGFIAAVAELGGDRRAVVFAALVILLLPGLNKYRSYVIRDTGYLAFYIWSLVFLFRYWQNLKGKAVWAWLVCTVTAFLFRIEGAAFLLLMPAIMLAYRFRNSNIFRLSASVALAVLGILLVGVFSLWTLSAELGADQAKVLSHPLSSVALAWERIGSELWFKLHALRQEFLGEFSGKYASIVFFLTLTTIVVVEVLRKLVIVYAFLGAHAVWRNLAFPKMTLRPLWGVLIAVNLLILTVFTLTKLFLTGRYTLGLVLTVLLAVPFSLSYFYESWRDHGPGMTSANRWVFPVLALLCVAVGVKGLDRFTDKRYLKTAGRWVAAHSATNENLYSNNRTLIYYSGKPAFRDGAKYDWTETMKIVWDGGWKYYDYLAVQISGKRSDHERRLLNKLGLRPVKTFQNQKGDRVLVFDTKRDTS